MTVFDSQVLSAGVIVTGGLLDPLNVCELSKKSNPSRPRHRPAQEQAVCPALGPSALAKKVLVLDQDVFRCHPRDFTGRFASSPDRDPRRQCEIRRCAEQTRRHEAGIVTWCSRVCGTDPPRLPSRFFHLFLTSSRDTCRMSESVELLSPRSASCEVSLSTNVDLIFILTPSEGSSLSTCFFRRHRSRQWLAEERQLREGMG